MSSIQSSHRRVILVHCDTLTSRRVLETAKNLDLFSGRKIWVLLDGVIGQELTSRSIFGNTLPAGMIALVKRPPIMQDARSLSAIIKVIGDAIMNANSHWKRSSDEVILEPKDFEVSCWWNATASRTKFSQLLYR